MDRPQLTALDLITNFLSRVDIDSFVLGVWSTGLCWLIVRLFSAKGDSNSFMFGVSLMAMLWLCVRVFAQRDWS